LLNLYKRLEKFVFDRGTAESLLAQVKAEEQE